VVIPTIFIDLQTAFPVAILLTLAARRKIESEAPAAFARYVKAGAGFGLLYGLAVGFWCFAYPDWMWGYALKASEWSTWWWYPGFVGALALAGAAGAFFAQQLIARRAFYGAVLLGVFGLWLLASIWAMTFEAYMHLSTYDAWHAIPRGPSILTNQDPRWVTGSIIVSVVMVIYVVGTMVRFVLEGRRLNRAA